MCRVVQGWIQCSSSGWDVQWGMFNVGCSRLEVQWVGGSGVEVQGGKFTGSTVTCWCKISGVSSG